MQSHIARTLQPAYRTRYNKLQHAIDKHLAPHGVVTSSPPGIVGGYFIWILLPPPLRADDVAAACLAQEKLVIAPGSLFAVYGDEKAVDLERGVRLTFSWEEEDLLEEGVERMARVLASMRRGKA